MKRAKKLILLTLALAAALTGYFTLSRLTAKGDTDSGTPGVTVASMDEGAVAGLSWTYGGQTVAFEKTDGVWQYSDDPDFPLDTDKLDDMLSEITDITSHNEITDAAALQDYGLDKPACSVTVTLDDGSSAQYAIGSKNDITDDYYLAKSGTASVYTVSEPLLKAFSVGLMDMVKEETLPAVGDVVSVSIERPDGTITLENLGEGNGLTYSDKYTWFYENGSQLLPVKTTSASDLSKAVTGLKWAGCVSYHAGSADLAAFGLADPRAKVTVRGKAGQDGAESAFTLLIGNSYGGETAAGTGTDSGTDSGGCYAMLPGSKMVYLIGSSTAEALLKADYDSLRPADVCAMDWSTVDAIDATVDGKSVTVNFTRTETSGSGGTAASAVSYTVGGTQADPEKVGDFLDSIYDMQSSGSAAEAPSSAADIVLIFHRSTASDSAMTLTFSPCDEDNCLADLDGQVTLVKISDVQALRDAFAALTQA